ncbi:MAG: hypothetical protein KY449_11470 [Proteobacteria bacterium]|nr:hypothetical protein [Pseudomonadota bacterium]
MALRDRYVAEVARASEAEAPRRSALEELRSFAAGLPDELRAMQITPFDVELFEAESELRVDTGPCMVIVRAQPDGGFRLAHEVKSAADYTEIETPGVDTVERLEAEMARILASFR